MNILEEMSPRLAVEKVSPNGEMVVVTVRDVTKETADYGTGEVAEYVVYIQGFAKGIRLNKTNAKNIIAALNTGETTEWLGRQLYCQGHWVRTPQGQEAYSWRFDKRPVPMQQAQPPVAAQTVAAQPPQNQYPQDAVNAPQETNPQVEAAQPAAAPPPGNTPAQGGQAWPPPAEQWDGGQGPGEENPDDVEFMGDDDEFEDDEEGVGVDTDVPEPTPAPAPAKKRRRRKAAAATAA